MKKQLTFSEVTNMLIDVFCIFDINIDAECEKELEVLQKKEDDKKRNLSKLKKEWLKNKIDFFVYKLKNYDDLVSSQSIEWMNEFSEFIDKKYKFKDKSKLKRTIRLLKGKLK